MTFVIPLADQPCAAVAGSDAQFPIRRVFCIGRNYADHAREMGHDPDREPPFFFMKPAWSIVSAGGEVPYPPKTENLHFEIELVAALGVGGKEIAVEDALDHVWGYGVGIDLTRRDRQGEAKKAGRPWDVGKGFDASGPMGPLFPVSEAGHKPQGRIWLSVNGDLRQDGDLGQMIWSLPEIIAELSSFFTLEAGDLIFTGTPAGVGALLPGDQVKAGIEGLGEIEIEIGEKSS